MPPARRGTRKGPTDLTGRTDEQLKAAKAAELDAAAESMAMATAVKRKSKKAVVDFTDAARPKPEITPTSNKPFKDPGPRIVRILAGIENMTFGKEIVFSGDFADPNNPKMPILGSLKTYTFEEGREYKVDYPLYCHLRDLGYVYDYDDDEDEDEDY